MRKPPWWDVKAWLGSQEVAKKSCPAQFEVLRLVSAGAVIIVEGCTKESSHGTPSPFMMT